MKRLKEQKRPIKNILKAIVYIAFTPLTAVIYIIPRKSDYWVFGYNNGRLFSDNPKHFFRWINAHFPSINTIWITKNKKLRNSMRQDGYYCYHAYEPKGIYYSLVSKVWIFSQTTSDINHWASFGALKVNLWHGTPIKKIMFDHDLGKATDSLFEKIRKRILNPGAFAKPNLFMTASEHVADIMKTAWRLNDDAIRITGYPRNDVLFNKPNTELLQSTIGHPKKNFSSYIIYLPTFRRDTVGDYETDWPAIQSLLCKSNACLLIKLHPLDTSGFDTSSLPNIHFLESSTDIYEILPLTSGLITDYSSIAFDYMLLDRPIIYYAFDLDDYTSNERDFYSTFEEVAAGPIARNTTELIDHIEKEILLKEDSSRHKRLEIAKKYNTYFDGNSCPRVYNEINSWLFNHGPHHDNDTPGRN